MFNKHPKYYVFIDVDQTLIRIKSMAEFMSFFLDRGHTQLSQQIDLNAKRHEFNTIISLQKKGVVNREELNRRYYSLFSGVVQFDLEQIARDWVLKCMCSSNFFNELLLTECAKHRENQASIVMISGSFPEVLNPIKEHIAADALLCSQLEISAGVFTGKLLKQAIGEFKWVLIRDFLNNDFDRMSMSYAYGDDASDLHYMEKVGHPIVVGKDEKLRKTAIKKGWHFL